VSKNGTTDGVVSAFGWVRWLSKWVVMYKWDWEREVMGKEKG
jgi:hypothetical protein